MAQPELLKYIQENTGKFEKPALVQALVDAGWQLADINAAFLESEKPAPVQPAQPATEPAQKTPPSGAPLTAEGVSASASAAQVTQPQSAVPAMPQAPVIAAVVQPVVQQPQVKATPEEQNSNKEFLAEMQRHRKEAEAMHPSTIVEGDVQLSVGAGAPAASSGLAGMVLKTGLVKTEQQANMVLIGGVVAVLAIAAWFIL